MDIISRAVGSVVKNATSDLKNLYHLCIRHNGTQINLKGLLTKTCFISLVKSTEDQKNRKFQQQDYKESTNHYTINSKQ